MLFPPLTPVVAAAVDEEPYADPLLLPVVEGLLVAAASGLVVVAAALVVAPIGLLVVLPASPDETTAAWALRERVDQRRVAAARLFSLSCIRK